MSDLISRKALITEIEINMADICNADVREGMEFAIELINSIPTAFDKEKVIAKLKDQYNYSRKVRNENGNEYFEYWDGRTGSYKDAIEVVEKGGIE